MARQYLFKRLLGRFIYNKIVHRINKKYLKEEYIVSVNRVIDYIEKNIDRNLKLESLSRIANFSKFYFHRTFKAVTGEAVNRFIQRIRLEKAAFHLIINKKESITDIAHDFGFESPASFSTAFKERFMITPAEWRKYPQKKKSNIDKSKSKPGKDIDSALNYFKDRSFNLVKQFALSYEKLDRNNLKIDVADFPDTEVAYLRYSGPFLYNDEQIYKTAYRLIDWGRSHNLRSMQKGLILIYHDHRGITDDSKHRISVCTRIPADIEVSGEIGKTTIPGGKYGVGHFEVPINEELDAWRIMYMEWLPNSGYKLDSRWPFAVYFNDRRKDPDHLSKVDICIPIISQ